MTHKVHLTPREEQILELVARGLTSREIAKKLKCHQRTIEQHRYRIRRALGTRGNNVLHLVLAAKRQGFLKNGAA